MNIRVYCEVTFNENPTLQVTRVRQLRFPLKFDINGIQVLLLTVRTLKLLVDLFEIKYLILISPY